MSDSHNLVLLDTADGVIDAIGGTVAAAKVGKVTPQAMTNARSRNRLPYPTFLLMTQALTEIGRQADPRLWGIKPLERS
jgi:hypothetical protein